MRKIRFFISVFAASTLCVAASSVTAQNVVDGTVKAVKAPGEIVKGTADGATSGKPVAGTVGGAVDGTGNAVKKTGEGTADIVQGTGNVVGGNVSRGGVLVIAWTLLGETSAGRLIRRSGARLAGRRSGYSMLARPTPRPAWSTAPSRATHHGCRRAWLPRRSPRPSVRR